MKINISLLIIICCTIALLFLGLIYVIISSDEPVEYISAGRLYDSIYLDIDTVNNTSVFDYLGYEEGDIVRLKDTIHNIIYHSSNNQENNEKNQTEIQFQIENELALRFYFKEDITDQFHINDTVTLIFHINHVKYAITNPLTNVTSTYERDVPMEGYEKNYFLKYHKVLLPKEAITKI